MNVVTRVLDLEERAQKAAAILKSRQRISEAEFSQIYSLTYPHMQPSEADILLQMGQRMHAEVVKAELGPHMEKIYRIANDYLGFEQVDSGRYAAEPGLHRHLWDTAWRANMLGLPLNTRMVALLHDVPEFAGYGIPQTVEALKKIGNYINEYSLEDLASMTDFSAVIMRDFFRTMQKKGKSLNDVDHAGILRAKEARTMKAPIMQSAAVPKYIFGLVNAAYSAALENIGTAIEALHEPKKRLVPVTAASGVDWVMDEAIARANVGYAAGIYEHSKEKFMEGKDQYDTVLLVKALAHIDRLRTTMGDFARTERATREAMNFTQNLDRMLDDLTAPGIVNNYLVFLSMALKTETINLLRQETENFSRRPDTTARYAATFLDKRLQMAKSL